jgi:hypothetical protein
MCRAKTAGDGENADIRHYVLPSTAIYRILHANARSWLPAEAQDSDMLQPWLIAQRSDLQSCSRARLYLANFEANDHWHLA